VAVWLCLLPVRFRIYSLPALLQKISVSKARWNFRKPELDQSIDLAVRVCNLSVFRLPCFPLPCLKQSLVLYRELTRMCYPAIIHFGVYKQGAGLIGHSWVTLNGKLVAEPASITAYSMVYSFPDSR
jgi:hypothetical protein